METYITLLRGINVGGKNLLPMKELRGRLESLGCTDVTTYIQSGNVVFKAAAQDPSELGEKITRAIEESHQFAPHTLVLKAQDIQAAVAANPFPEAAAEPKTLHCSFLAEQPSAPDLEAMAGLAKANERFHLEGRYFYLHAPDGIGRSKLAAKVERLLGVPATARNWRTVEKLIQMIR